MICGKPWRVDEWPRQDGIEWRVYGVDESGHEGLVCRCETEEDAKHIVERCNAESSGAVFLVESQKQIRRSAIESLAREIYLHNPGDEPLGFRDSVDLAISFYEIWDARKADIDEACNA